MKDFIFWLTGISVAVAFASFFISIIMYSKYRSTWMVYYLVYASIAIVACVLHQFRYFYNILVSNSNLFENVFLPYIQFIIILIQGIVIPFFLMKLIGNKITSLIKIIIFGNIILLCTATIGYNVSFFILSSDFILTVILYYCVIVTYYLYGIIIIYFIVYGLIKWKTIIARYSKKGMIFFLLSSALYIPTVFISRIISIPENMQFIGYLYFPAYIFIWFTAVLFINLKILVKNSDMTNTAIPESFINEYGITNREKEILFCLLEGQRSKHIADSLFISIKTVNTHIYNIFTKCKATSRMQLANIIKRFS